MAIDLAHDFRDPIHPHQRVILHCNPSAPLFDALTVEHPGCASRADVSADLDAFYCRACGWNGRISGAWAVSVWEDGQGPTGECPGGLTWDCCHADDCGVREDGTGCELASRPVAGLATADPLASGILAHSQPSPSDALGPEGSGR